MFPPKVRRNPPRGCNGPAKVGGDVREQAETAAKDSVGRGGVNRSEMVMKVLVGLIAAAGIAISAGTVSAQSVYPRVASDLDGPYADEPYTSRPYAEPPPYAALPPRVYGPPYGERRYDERTHDEPGYVPTVLPSTAIYGILRDRGYSPLGIPQQRGFVYTISVISPDGDDGRLVIDARSGRILRFLPAYRLGDRMNNEITVSYGPAGAPPPVPTLGALPRPPAAMPRLASRTPNVPLPKPMPARVVATPAKPVAPKTATVPATKPVDAHASIQQQPAAAAETAVPSLPPAVIEAKPTAQSSQEMPPVQGLE